MNLVGLVMVAARERGVCHPRGGVAADKAADGVMKTFILLAAAVVVFVVSPVAAFAEPAPTLVPPAGDGERVSTGSLLGIVQDGGILMVPLFGCSFLLASFGIERLVSLRWGRVVPRLFINRFVEQLEAGELTRDEALDACEANGSPAANVFAAAVRRWGKPAVELEQAVIDACERELNHLRRYRRIFSSVATIGPLLGLLGTVFGLIRSFNDVASAGAMGRPDLLAKGFGEALITTAMGLVVAIPAMLLHSLFTSRADRLALRLDETAQRVIDCVALETANDPRRRKRNLGAAA